MNHVLLLTHNCLSQTIRAVASVRNQCIPTKIHVVDNGSKDGTLEYLEGNHMLAYAAYYNQGVSKGWNIGLRYVFTAYETEYCLVINNDVELPPWFYYELLTYQVPFITGVSTDQKIVPHPTRAPLVPHPDFSAFLIRRDAWEEIGEFDEHMVYYAQDCDYHIRACRVGIPLLAANVPFYHDRSSTLRLATDGDRRHIEVQADEDRAYFRQKWGFAVGSVEYQKATGSRAGTRVPFPGENGTDEGTGT